MEKPKKQKLEYYDYHECSKYIYDKYGIDIEDVNGTFDHDGNGKPFHCFWNFLVDTISPNNGSYFVISEYDKEDAEEWEINIVNIFLKEFGKKDENGTLIVNLYVSW